jgi:hypothetical protein
VSEEGGREGGEHHCHLRHEMFVLFRNRLLPIFDELKASESERSREAVEIGVRERGGTCFFFGLVSKCFSPSEDGGIESTIG